MPRRHFPLAVSVLLVVACAGGTADGNAPTASPGSSAPASPSSTPTATPDRVLSLGDEPMSRCLVEGTAAVCGTLTVPEDRANPAGRTIDLRVTVLPARAEAPEPDPFFVLAGGPGGAAATDMAWTGRVFGAVQATRDIVLVDQRGTGDSNRLVLPDRPDVSGLDAAAAAEANARWLREAIEELPGDLRFYTTSVAMDDLDDVRAALGYESINLFGASYGATAAQYYLRQHEAHVRSVVLDGGTLLDVPIFERIAASSQAALDLLFDRCAAEPACDDTFPRLGEEFDAIMAGLERSPVTTTVVDPVTGSPAIIDAPAFAGAVHSVLVREDLLGRLPAFIHLAASGAWDEVVEAALAAVGSGSEGGDELAMALVIRCSEAWARFDPAEVARAGAGSYYLEAQLAGARAFAETCAQVPTGVVPPDDAAPVRSDVPVLLVLGEADPQDPEANVVDAPVELPNSLTIVVPGQSHTVAHLGCMPSIVAEFVEAGTAEGLDASCVATGVAPPVWVLSPG